jgi:hypothetical protein
VADVRHALGVDVLPCEQHVDRAAEVDHRLGEGVPVLFRLVEVIRRAPVRLRSIPRIVGEDRDRTGAGVELGLGDELRPAPASPVTEDDGGERPLALRHHEIGADALPVGAGVRDIVDRGLGRLADDGVVHVERLAGVILEGQWPGSRGGRDTRIGRRGEDHE